MKNLTRLADLIRFSAAIPEQGAPGHVNEQWPDYSRQRFEAEDYELVDWFRPRFWQDDAVAPWYRQNGYLYVRSGHPLPAEVRRLSVAWPLDAIHPRMYRISLERPPRLKELAHTVRRELPQAVRNYYRHRRQK